MDPFAAGARLQILLTACAVAIGVALFAAFPWRLVTLLYLPSLPLALTLLWLTREVPSPAERSARTDAEPREPLMATDRAAAFRRASPSDPIHSVPMSLLGLVKRRGLLRLVTLLALALGGAQAAVACNDTALIGVPTCRPGLCTCEEDPAQPTCKGFNERPEGGPPAPFDGGDAGDSRAPIDGSDAQPPPDAPDDAGDEAG